ncbi:MAG: hypothetical protein J6X81_04020 [Muribaculaceae bacterium]|nr:hypothetical protein [Muribaculaceae bacterium]
MKSLLFIIPFSAVAIALLSCCKSGSGMLGGKDAPMGRLKAFSYTENASMAQPERWFDIKLNDDSATATLIVRGVRDIIIPEDRKDDYDFQYQLSETGDSVQVPASVLDSVAQVIISHKMYKYKEHYRPRFEVFDGTSWSLNASYDNYEDGFSSGGYMEWPSDDGIDIVAGILKEAYLAAHK